MPPREGAGNILVLVDSSGRLLRVEYRADAAPGRHGRDKGAKAMNYVMLLRWKQGLTREQRDGALARRSQWKYPDGIELLAEYWPAADDPAVVSIFRTDDYAG